MYLEYNTSQIIFTLINAMVCLFTIIAISYKYSQIKNMIDEFRDRESSTDKEEVKYVEEKPKKKSGVVRIAKSLLQLENDDDSFDEFDEEEHQKVIQINREKSKTEEIIDLIDLYEAEMNLSHKLVEDIKAHKFNKLDKEILKELNVKYRQEEVKTIAKTTSFKPVAKYTTQYTLPSKPLNTNRRKMFITGQDMVDYVAQYSRMVYDQQAHTVRKVESFSLDIYGNLLIYYDKYDLPRTFKPYLFGEAS